MTLPERSVRPGQAPAQFAHNEAHFRQQRGAVGVRWSASRFVRTATIRPNSSARSSNDGAWTEKSLRTQNLA
jgi:hypothetical protein